MKSHKKLFFWIIVIAIVIVGVLYFTQRHKQSDDTKMYYSYTMESTKSVGKLGLESSELNSQTLLNGMVCVNNASNVSKIDLYMPDMGHGSSPPVVSKASNIPSSLNVIGKKNDYGCFNVSKLEMFMPGLWQVRVFYQNGDSGIFNITLEK